MEINPELINQFKEFTGNSDDNVARNTLVACDGNLEQAVGLFFASDGAIGANPQQNHQAPPAAVVNEINSDDEVEILDESRGRQNRPIVLDDSDVDEDGVRRPMQPVTERLVGQSYRQYYDTERRNPAHPIFEQYHDFNAEQAPDGPVTRRRRAHQAASSNSSNSEALASLFRPPIDIIARYDWNALLQAAQRESRWVLVNIQDPTEFACQVLNRDCFSNEELKALIKEKMLFWQVYQNSPDGRRVTGYYSIKDFPSIFIVDPRTSERVHLINTRDPLEMIVELRNFSDRFPNFIDFDKELRNKMNPLMNLKPTTSVEFDLEDEDSNQSNKIEEPKPTTSNHVAIPEAKPEESLPQEPPSLGNSMIGGQSVKELPAGPAQTPDIEALREQRNRFLRQFENK